MNTLLTVILVILVAFFAFKTHILLGIGFIIIGGVYAYFANYSTLMAGRANALYSNGEKDKALSYYKKAVSKGNPKLTTYCGYAFMLLRCGNPEEALTQINKVLSTSRLPLDIKNQAKQIRSLINYKLGEVDEAYEEAIDIYESGYTVSVMRAVVGLLMHAANKPYDETLKFCEEAYDYDSDSRDIVDNYLLALINAKEYEKAKEISDILLETQPEFAETYYHSALLYKALGDNKKAKELLEKYPDCKTSYMTTVSEKDFKDLKATL